MTDYVLPTEYPYQNLPSRQTPLYAGAVNSLMEFADSIAATYAPTPSPTPPADPTVGQEWLSSALTDVQVSPALQDRTVLFTPLTGENHIQEVSVWVYGDYYYGLLSVIGGLSLRRCALADDPMVATNWAKITGTGSNGEVIGAGAATAHRINHSYVLVAGSTLYCFGNDTTDDAIVVFTASIATPQTWTLVGTCLTSGQRPAGFDWGNIAVAQDSGTGTWWMLVEYAVNSDSGGPWQLTWASSSTLTGAYAIAGPTPLTSLYPNANYQTGSGAQLIWENDQWVLIFHAQNYHNNMSLIFRATAPSLGQDNFTVLDQVPGSAIASPLVQPASHLEIGQVCDPHVLAAPNGQRYLFWTGNDYRPPTGPQAVYGAPLLPVRKRWNGSVWQRVDASRSPLPGVMAASRPGMTTLTTNFSGTSTSSATFIKLTWAPYSTDAEMELVGVVTSGTTGLYKFMSAPDGVPTFNMGSVYLVSGQATSIALRARMTGLTPGRFYSMWAFYSVPAGGGTLNCRPVAQAGIETMTLRCVDLAVYQL